MNCNQLENNLIDWVTAKKHLSDNRVIVHLKGCPACSKLYTRFEQDLLVIQAEKLLKPSAQLTENILKQIRAEDDTSKTVGSFTIYKNLLATAALVAGLFIGIQFGNLYDQSAYTVEDPTIEDNYFLVSNQYETIEANLLNLEE